MTQKMLIRDKAKELGFDLVGFTTAEPFFETKKLLEQRKRDGQLSNFIDHDLKLITTPRAHLSSAESIISLGLSYASSLRIDSRHDYFLSIYAQGKDYHNIFYEKLARLIDYLEKLDENVETKSFVDTGPILDRAIAERAGLGWIGKNNNLINKDYGSYLFLGEILTNISFMADNRVENLCNECNKCIENCPGGALLEDHHLDPDRCIGYLTQKKGIIPNEERKKIGSSLWGCDKCQMVCPYNRNIPVDLHDCFAGRLDTDISQILNFSSDNIPRVWKNSALSWRGIRILRRNALIVIGNRKLIEYKDKLKELLDDPSSVIRAYALWALSELPGDSTEIIKKHFLKERTPEVKNEIQNIINI